MANDNEVSVKIGADVADLTSKLKEVGDSFKSVQSDIAKSVADSQRAIANASKQFQQELAAEEEAERKAAAAAYALKEANDQATASTEKSAFATAGSRRELMVIAHEIMTGNFSRIPGSLMVMANRMGGFGAAISGIGAAMMSPMAIAGLLAAAAIAAGIAFVKASEDMQKMNLAIGMTGNFAGETVSSMHALADSVSQSADISVLAASSIVTALVSLGQIGAGAIEEVTKAAAEHSRVTGDNAEKSAAWAEKMFAHPARGAREMSDTMHNLTAAELEHIEMLERTGQKEEAARELAEKYNKTATEQNIQLGILCQDVNLLAKAWDDLKAAMLGIGKPQTLDETIKEEEAKLRSLKAENSWLFDNTEKIKGEEIWLGFLKKNKQAIVDTAEAKKEENKVTEAGLRLLEASKEYSGEYKERVLQEKINALKKDYATAKYDVDSVAGKEALDAIERAEIQLEKMKERQKVAPSKMLQYEEDLNQRKVSMLDTSKGGEGRELSKEEEKAFWQEMLLIADKGSKDYQAIQRKISGDELATLREKQKLGLEKRAAEEKDALAVITAKEVEVKQSLAMGLISEVQELAALRELEDAKHKIRLDAAQVRRDEFARNSIEYQKAADSILVIERAHSAAVVGIENSTAKQYKAIADEKRAAEEKEALAVITAKEAEVKQSLAMGEINKIQELAALRELEDAKYRIRLAAAQSRRDEFALDSIEYQKAADAILVLERAHSTAVITIDNETAREHRRVWMDMAKPITDAMDKSVTGVIQGTTTLKKAFADLANSIALEITKMIIKTNMEIAMSKLFQLTGGGGDGIGGMIAGLFGGGGGGGGMSGFSAAQLAGPIMSSAGGEWNVPSDRLNFVHKNETILPASMAQKFRDNVENGGKTTTLQVTNNFTVSGAVDRSTQDQIALMASQSMQSAMRRNG